MKVFNKGKASRKFITIVRDAETGTVLSATRGKGSDGLKMFNSRIKRSKAKIKYVCMDMSNAYGAWAKDGHDAYCLLGSWCSMAEATQIPEVMAMAKTIRNHMKGILGYWRLGGAANASMEGFNGKVRWLVKQAFGFRDFKYFRLKIFDLPSTDIKKNFKSLSRIMKKSRCFVVWMAAPFAAEIPFPRVGKSNPPCRKVKPSM
jgi:hypothetical protein